MVRHQVMAWRSNYVCQAPAWYKLIDTRLLPGAFSDNARSLPGASSRNTLTIQQLQDNLHQPRGFQGGPNQNAAVQRTYPQAVATT
jgi:hypothetical protein